MLKIIEKLLFLIYRCAEHFLMVIHLGTGRRVIKNDDAGGLVTRTKNSTTRRILLNLNAIICVVGIPILPLFLLLFLLDVGTIPTVWYFICICT